MIAQEIKAFLNPSDEGLVGCSCEQIIGALGLGKGNEKFECSTNMMDGWVNLPRLPIGSLARRLY